MVSKYTWNKILFYLTVPFRFNFWMMNNEYSEGWDIKLRKLMATNKFKINDNGYIAYLGDHVVWIVNYPYASFCNYTLNELKVRPSRYTIYLARKKLMKDIFDV